MKKIHLMAAAAALLLSGGVFVKANQENNQIFDANLEALTTGIEQIVWIGEGTTILQDQVISNINTIPTYAYIGGKKKIIELYYVNRCVPCCNRQCYGALENDVRWYDDDYICE